ncbi:MAG: hypothetical protein ACRCUX_07765 [Beijerinckiaceae bacterium]
MLQPLHEFLAALDAAMPPARHSVTPAAAAIGHVLAADVVAPLALPRSHVALESGFAVASRGTIGASVHAPVVLAHAPVHVAIGDPLPMYCDAVCDLAILENDGRLAQVMEQVAPGQGVRFAGHDLAAGETVARRGEIFSCAHALACAQAEIASVETVAWPIVVAPHDDPSRAWLVNFLNHIGGVAVERSAPAALNIQWSADVTHAVALSPGGTLRLTNETTLTLPHRFDAVAGVLFAVLLPHIAARSGRRIALHPHRLLRKIASPIGLSEVVLLATSDDGITPLCVGDITLEALLRADAFAIIPSDFEGFPAGTVLPVTPLARPLIPDIAQ